MCIRHECTSGNPTCLVTVQEQTAPIYPVIEFATSPQQFAQLCTRPQQQPRENEILQPRQIYPRVRPNATQHQPEAARVCCTACVPVALHLPVLVLLYIASAVLQASAAGDTTPQRQHC